ncbi:hypothetical protein CANCADRAFT_2290 [Tortispora caseinolytica NRRL Y-17796]|uniref:RRM domain-containing protein n=1 Tax=Tortispora caseinolytica NRRL Y-17796 TaxID=767744 RepID=A0A1E4TFM7_9ASCO|nr:hypothetical protein CANCADRAFT_2290 [Tortispora caseinolytica NRRL Y-17796]
MATAQTVLVGGIPYDVTEEQLSGILSTVGPVLSCNLVFDPNTGRPTGYGFAVYRDIDTAQSAIRNLSGYAVGNGFLSVKPAGGDMPMAVQKALNSNGQNGGRGGSSAYEKFVPSAEQPLPKGVQLHNGMSASEAISKVMYAIPIPQQLEFLHSVQRQADANEDMVIKLLEAAPQLGFAIVQSLLLTELIDSQKVTELVRNNGDGSTAGSNPYLAPGAAVPAATQSAQATEPTVSAGVSDGAENAPQSIDPETQQQMIKQVLELTPEQIALLPADQQEMIRQVQQQFQNAA